MIYHTMVQPVAVYGSATWVMTEIMLYQAMVQPVAVYGSATRVMTEMGMKCLGTYMGEQNVKRDIWTGGTARSLSQWPHGLRRRSAAARLLRLWVRILLRAWIFVYCECCVLSGRGLCDELITRPEESYRLWYVVVCDLETSRMRRT
jgi:hypothetical protein